MDTTDMNIKILLTIGMLLIATVGFAKDMSLSGGSGGGSKTWRVTANSAEVISGIKIRAGNRIDAISFNVSTVADYFNHKKTEKFGGNGGAEYEFNLDKGECITEVRGTTGVSQKGPSPRIFTLQFETNRGRKSPIYGSPAYSNRRNGTDFSIEANSNEEINGFYGFYGNELDAIGGIVRNKLHCK